MEPSDLEKFSIHPDLAEAFTLPSRYYIDPAFYEMEKERIFGKTWQVIGRADQVSKPGSFLTANVADEPVVAVRGEDGRLRTFSNVCRHRGSVIAQGDGILKSLQCPYHSWTYDLQGRLLKAPECEGLNQWSESEVRLPEFKTETLGPILFIHVGKEPIPFQELVGNIPHEIQSHGFPLERYRFLTRTEYTIACNWKVYVDNYLEGYHLPSVHPALYRELAYDQYRVDTFRYYSSQWAPLRPFSQPPDKRRYDPNTAGPAPLYYWIFPNTIISIYPDNLHVTIVIPLSVDKTLTIFDWYKLPESAKSVEETTAFSDQVQKEDIEICEKVQAGLRSRHYDRGRFSVKRENGVHHFHRLFAEFLQR